MGFGGFDFSEAFARGAGRGRPPQADSANFQDIFSQWFNRQHESPQSAPQKGSDLEYGLNIDFWQAIKGTQVRLKISRQEECTTCGGTGSRSGANTVCPECNGSGNVTQMAGAMRFSLTCPKCEGTGRLRNRCAACHGENGEGGAFPALLGVGGKPRRSKEDLAKILDNARAYDLKEPMPENFPKLTPEEKQKIAEWLAQLK